jgi:hypothetical protein
MQCCWGSFIRFKRPLPCRPCERRDPWPPLSLAGRSAPALPASTIVVMGPGSRSRTLACPGRRKFESGVARMSQRVARMRAPLAHAGYDPAVMTELDQPCAGHDESEWPLHRSQDAPPHSRGADSARALQRSVSLQSEGAGNAGCSVAPAALCAKGESTQE